MIQLMIVEDDAFILDDLASIVDWAAEGYSLITATNGKQALAFYERYRPMIVVADVRMPFMDGLQMMAAIREQNPYVQFLILSAYSDFGQVQKALRQGATDYLLKRDISAELLMEKIGDMRRAISEQAELNLRAVKNTLYELLSSPPDDREVFREQLEEIIALGEKFPEDELLAPARDFAAAFIHEQTGLTSEFTTMEEGAGECAAFFRTLPSFYLSIGHFQGSESGTGKRSRAVNLALAYIQDHYTDPLLGTGEIAKAVGVSYSRLSVLFKEETGKTITDHLTDTRIEAAKRLLDSGDVKVYEVAERVGYRSSQYFSYAFREKTGVSPKKYGRGE